MRNCRMMCVRLNTVPFTRCDASRPEYKYAEHLLQLAQIQSCWRGADATSIYCAGKINATRRHCDGHAIDAARSRTRRDIRSSHRSWLGQTSICITNATWK
ncbi:hypothetical protein FOWG_12929 [Fusarium oxysporum f. sp. lycopersici MN25]|nr:hypothetical protein FOWG_12929 [Fusarium oxysporum f. sp. lycopersici MN25]